MSDDPEYWAAGLKIVGGLILVAVVVVAITLGILGSCTKADAAPVWLDIDTGITSFKWNNVTDGRGMPLFHDPRWDVTIQLEWAPGPVQRAGFFLTAGFKYQALGESKYAPETFVDGPRVGIKYRGRLTQ